MNKQKNSEIRDFMRFNEVNVVDMATILCAFQPGLTNKTVYNWYMGKSISDRNFKRVEQAYDRLIEIGNKREIEWARETQV